MAQADYIISNQTFPNTRADINSTLQAIATTNSGTSAPSTQYAGQFWLDTTSSNWVLYIHDGADDIQFATIDTSANTVNFIDSALDVVTDSSPQLGGNLDLNSNDITGTGNINITGTIQSSGNITGTLATASQPNITSVGTLTSFTSTGIDDNATSTAITIDSSERVGIGTNFSSRNLPSVGIPQLKVEGANTGASTVLVVNTANDTTPSAFALLKARGSSVVQNGDEIGRISFNGWDGNEERESASISAFVDNYPSTADMPGRLVFKTSPDASATPLERMRITSAGLVGINNSAPSQELEVYGTIKAHEKSGLAQGSILIDALATGNPHLAFQQEGTYKGYIHYLDASDTICLNDGSGNGLHYSPTLQRLGIGTSSPSTSLHISQSVPIITLTDTDVNVSHQLSGQSSSRHFNLKVDTGGSSGSPVFNLSMQDSIKLSVLNNGNLGIGTIDPSQKLDVVGSIEVSDGIYIGGTGTANKLDDYEEGTHTATLTPSTSGSITSDGTRDTLSYTKVGRVVHLQGFLDDFTVSSPVGYIKMSLPFTISDLTEESGRSCPTLAFNNVVSANISDFIGFGVEGADHIRIYLGDGVAFIDDSAQQWQASTQMHVSFTYITD